MMKRNPIVSLLMVVAASLILCGIATAVEQNKSEQVSQIEKYISEQRQQIEDFYARRFTELQLRLDAELRLLETSKNGKTIRAGFARWADYTEAVLQINNCNIPEKSFFAESKWTAQRGRLTFLEQLALNTQRLAEAEDSIARKKNDIITNYEWALAELEIQKRYALTVQLTELKQRLKEKPAKPAEPTRGMLQGIVYSKQKPSALIEGKVVHEGDRLHKVKVTKINKDSVVFEKNNKTWKQKVREKQSSAW